MGYPHDRSQRNSPYPHQRQPQGANTSYYGPANEKYPQEGQSTVPPGVAPGPDGERGLGSKILGGAGGGYLGHKFGGGMLGAAGGALAGAAGMGLASKL